MTVTEFAREIGKPRWFVYDLINRGVINSKNKTLRHDSHGRPHVSYTQFMKLYGMRSARKRQTAQPQNGNGN